MDTPWQFQLLGKLSAQRGDLAVARFATSRIGALLARLVLSSGSAHSREELIELLWPDGDQDAGRLSLRVALASLRRQIEPPDVPPGSILIADRTVVRLNPLACRSDVAAFEAALKSADRAPDAQTRRRALDQAVALYSGELLPGFWDEWILDERERLAALYDAAVERRQALPAATLTAALALPPDETPAGRPPLRGFPLQFTRFFGRDEECAQAAEWLRDAGTRLLTLSGPGGAGKTRLSAQIAQRVAGDFGGPVCFVPLADLGQPSLIPDAVAQALGLPRTSGAEPLDQVVAALADQPPALLVLDNFEHLVDGGGPFVFSLLSRLPTLTCLVTSRRRLGLPGEREFPVPPLPLPDADAPLEHVSLASSVRLFVDRAQAARPDFQLTRGNANAVADLCRRLEGLPLAIELVAARAQALTLAQMAERLAQRFELLTSRRGDKGGRHRSLWAAMAWSYDLLSPDLQTFFLRLSVFRGGCTPPSAEAVCGESRAGEFLTQLRERSLLGMAEEHGELRFRLPESLREFGEERLSLGERADLARSHAAYFSDLAGQMAALWGGPKQRIALTALDGEADNLRAALAFCRTDDGEGDPVATGLRLAGSLGQYWTTRGLLREGLDWLDGALARGGADEARAKALAEAGWLAAGLADYDRADPALTESIALSRRGGDGRGEAYARRLRGIAATWRGDNPQASCDLEESLQLSRSAGDESLVASALLALGVLANQWNQDDTKAGALYAEALALFRKQGDGQRTAYCLHNLGNIAGDAGDHDRAETLLRESLALAGSLGDEWHRAYCLRSLGDVAEARGDLTGATRLLEEGRALCRRLGDRMTEAGTICSLASVARQQGDWARAEALEGTALALYQDMGHAEGAALSRINLAEIAASQNQWARAAGLLALAASDPQASLSDAAQARLNTTREAARAALGAEAFEAAWKVEMPRVETRG